MVDIKLSLDSLAKRLLGQDAIGHAALTNRVERAVFHEHGGKVPPRPFLPTSASIPVSASTTGVLTIGGTAVPVSNLTFTMATDEIAEWGEYTNPFDSYALDCLVRRMPAGSPPPHRQWTDKGRLSWRSKCLNRHALTEAVHYADRSPLGD